MSSLDRVKFLAASGGTGAFVPASPVTGFLTPAQSGMSNSQALSYIAFSTDQSQWEYGHSTYTVSGTSIARSPINSSTGGGTINFSAPPFVAVCLLSEDIATGAPPSVPVGLSLAAGSAATFMRSDAAPALSQAIVPTWTGLHTFSGGAVLNTGYVSEYISTGTITAAIGGRGLVWHDAFGTNPYTFYVGNDGVFRFAAGDISSGGGSQLFAATGFSFAFSLPNVSVPLALGSQFPAFYTDTTSGSECGIGSQPANTLNLITNRTVAGQISSAGLWRWPAYTTPGFLSNDSSGNITSTPGGAVAFAAMLALAIPANNTTAIVNDGGRSGTFIFNSTRSYATDVMNDPGQGITAAPTADTTGASGAWVRQYLGQVDFAWWGVIDDGVTTDPWGLDGIGPIIVSGTDNSLALRNWSLWAQARSAAGRSVSVVLKGGGQINYDASKNLSQFMLANIRNLSIDFNGSTFQNTYNTALSGGNFALSLPFPSTQAAVPTGYLIDSVTPGDTRIHVVTLGDIATSGVIVGDFISLQALDVEFLGTPANNYLYEFVQVTAVDSIGGYINIATPAKNKYLSTYPDYNLGAPCGKARFWMIDGVKIPQNLFTIWGITHVYSNVQVNLPPGGNTSIQTLSIINQGTGYTNGTYTNVPLTYVSGGNGAGGVGGTANIVVSGGLVTSATIVAAGGGYTSGQIVSASIIGGSGFQATVNVWASGYVSLSGLNMTLNNWTGCGLSETTAGIVIANYCNFKTQMETDKLVDYIIYNSCTSRSGIGCQSSVPNTHIVTGGSFLSCLGGAKEFVATGASFDQVNFAGGLFGYAKNTTYQNCVIRSLQQFPSVLDGALPLTIDGDIVTYSNGRITINSSIGGGITSWNVVPGMMVAWQAKGSDGSAGIFQGAIATGVVMDISDNRPSLTQFYIDTNLGATIPTVNVDSKIWLFHNGQVNFLNCTGCDDVRIASDACGAGYQYFNRVRYVFSGVYASSGRMQGFGNLISVAANVPVGRVGTDAGASSVKLAITFATYDESTLVADSGGTVVTINIGVAGNRLFTQSSAAPSIGTDDITVGGASGQAHLPTGRVINPVITYAFTAAPSVNYKAPQFELILTFDTGIVRKLVPAQFDVIGTNAILPVQGLLP